jgi:hypothetical protein
LRGETQERVNYRDLLQSKSRDELNLRARELRIPGFRKLSKPDLITAILEGSPTVSLGEPVRPSWWKRNYNHVYGSASLVGAVLSAIGLVLAIIFFAIQNSRQVSPASGANIEITSNANKSAGESGSRNQDQAEAAIAADATSFSPVTMEEFFKTMFDSNITQIQEDEFLAQQIGRRVIWEGEVTNASESSSGPRLMIRCETLRDRHAFLAFPITYRADLLALRRNQKVRVSGVLKEWNATYVNLEKSQLLRVWP